MQFAGKRAKCRKCGQPFTIPTDSLRSKEKAQLSTGNPAGPGKIIPGASKSSGRLRYGVAIVAFVFIGMYFSLRDDKQPIDVRTSGAGVGGSPSDVATNRKLQS